MVGIALVWVCTTISLTGPRVDGLEIDFLLDLSLFKTKLALLMNLVNPLGFSSGPPEPPWPEELIFGEI